MQEEVGKLVEVGIMREVQYHDWLSNPVMVRKYDNSWRMCVDFKDLNKACLKDGYPLREIDRKVESLCGFHFKCFLDAYKGSDQIQMAKEDEEKTAFITNQGIFCYTKMPFGLRNARATYQRLGDKAFHKQGSRNLKCTFGIEEGMFLGYKVSTRGLKVCPDKVDDVLSLPSPKCLKDVQKLNGKLTSLNRILPKLAKKSLPFFKTLKKCMRKSDFYWTMEAEEAFKQMKQLISELRMFVAPMEKEELILYLAAAKETVSAVLMTKQKAKQMPIYFVSISLRDFIVEQPEEESPYTLTGEEVEFLEPWILFTDGSSCTDGSRAGLKLTNPEGTEFTYALRFRFDAANNEAEYEALIAELKIAKQMGVKNLQGNVDSRLVANQVNGTYVAKENDMYSGSVGSSRRRRGYMDDSHLQVAHGRNISSRSEKSENSKTFGLLGEIILDNGKQFQDNPFKDLCEKLCICQHFASVKHPQTNGLVERVNRSLREGIKARLDERSKNRMEELPHVVWAHSTMIKSSNRDTPFSLTYGTEAVIPAEISMPTLRTAEVDLVQNNKALEINLDLLEERREQAAIREAKSKAKMERYYNSKVRSIRFKPGDLVYRNNDASRAEDTRKLGPK
ncbi:reverse transcriptase domain-containing protein [Tanacetum coccineum]